MSTEMVKQENQSLERVSARPSEPPRVDLYENADELLLVADLPGVRTAGLRVELHDGILEIEGHREASPAGATALHLEHSKNDLVRRFSVPDGIDVDRIDASLSDGVLRLRLPKSAAMKPRRIEVRVD